jgi:hypothetical protein
MHFMFEKKGWDHLITWVLSKFSLSSYLPMES